MSARKQRFLTRDTNVMIITNIADEYGLKCRSHNGGSHMQYFLHNDLLINIWPSTLRTLTTGKSKSRQHDSDTALFQYLRKFCQDTVHKPVQDAAQKEFQFEPVAARQDIQWVDVGKLPKGLQASRMAKAVIQLDGDQVRIVVNGSYFSDSYRLSADDSLELLREASDMYYELKSRCDQD